MVFLLQEVSQMPVSVTIALVGSFHPVDSDTLTVDLVVFCKYFQQGFMCGGDTLKCVFQFFGCYAPPIS